MVFLMLEIRFGGVFSPLLEPTLSGLAINFFSGVLKWAFFIGGGNKAKAKFSKIPSCSFAFGEDLRGCEFNIPYKFFGTNLRIS